MANQINIGYGMGDCQKEVKIPKQNIDQPVNPPGATQLRNAVLPANSQLAVANGPVSIQEFPPELPSPGPEQSVNPLREASSRYNLGVRNGFFCLTFFMCPVPV